MSPEAKVRFEILKSASTDRWIALSEDESRIVAIGNTFAEVSERSDAAGEVDPVILKTPSAWETFSVSAR